MTVQNQAQTATASASASAESTSQQPTLKLRGGTEPSTGAFPDLETKGVSTRKRRPQSVVL